MNSELSNSEKPKFIRGMKCLSCGETYSLEQLKKEQGSTMVNICYNACMGPLDLDYDYDAIGKILTKEEVEKRGETFWRLRELLPIHEIKIEDRNYTPLVKSKKIGEELGIELYFKLDLGEENPTRSFKDRPTTLAFNRAVELGYEEAYVASTGNLAISTAYFAKKYGIRAKFYIPRSLGEMKKNAIRENLGEGSEILELDCGYDECNLKSIEDSEKLNEEAILRGEKAKNFVPNNSFRPYYKEGSKTSGWEIAFQIAKEVGDEKTINIFYPIGSGALLCAADKGIRELRRLKLFSNPHRIFGVQPDTCSPVAQAWKKIKNGEEAKKVRIEAIKNPQTIAKSIAIGNPGSGYQALDVFAQSGGGAFEVSEEKVLENELRLIRDENLFPQFVGATVLSGIEKALEEGEIKKGDVVVANLTGLGKGRVEDDLLETAKKYRKEDEARKLLN